MTIHIDSLTFKAIIGLLDSEREIEQRVIVDIEAEYPYSDKHFIDYAEMTSLIEENLKTERYKLLEEALIGLQKRVSTAYPSLETLKIKVTKPDILLNCKVALSQSWKF